MKKLKNLLVLALTVSLISGFGAAAAEETDEQLLIAPAPVIAPAPQTYGDIQGKWFEQAAQDYGYAEIFICGDGLFYPDRAVTRMEFARLMHQALDINMNYFAPTDISEYFTDVKNSDAGASALYDLVTCGIIDKGASFNPAQTLSRAEMTQQLMRAFYYRVGQDYALDAASPKLFGDDKDISAYYRTPLYGAKQAGLVSGRGEGLFKPLESTTRAEAVTAVSRLCTTTKTISSGVSVHASVTEQDGKLTIYASVVNRSDADVTIEHGYGQLFDFVLLDKDGNDLYRWSAGKMFPAMMTQTVIKAGAETTFSETLDAQAYAAVKGRVRSAKAFVNGSSEALTLSRDGYAVASLAVSGKETQ